MTNTPNMKPESDSSTHATHEKSATGSPQADTQKHDAQHAGQKQDASKPDGQKAAPGHSQPESKPAQKS